MDVFCRACQKIQLAKLREFATRCERNAPVGTEREFRQMRHGRRQSLDQPFSQRLFLHKQLQGLKLLKSFDGTDKTRLDWDPVSHPKRLDVRNEHKETADIAANAPGPRYFDGGYRRTREVFCNRVGDGTS